MKALLARLKDFWASLPHQAQGALVAFGSGALTAFVDAAVAHGFNPAQLGRSAEVGITAGLIALKAFFSLASNAQQKLDKNADDKAAAEVAKTP